MVNQLASCCVLIEKEIGYTDRINQQRECGCVSIDEPVHGDIVNMMKGNTNKVLPKHGADSF